MDASDGVGSIEGFTRERPPKNEVKTNTKPLLGLFDKSCYIALSFIC